MFCSVDQTWIPLKGSLRVAFRPFIRPDWRWSELVALKPRAATIIMECEARHCGSGRTRRTVQVSSKYRRNEESPCCQRRTEASHIRLCYEAAELGDVEVRKAL